MNPTEFKALTKGMCFDEIISTAIECGYLENKDIPFGAVIEVPHWLAEILYETGCVEPL